MANIQGSSRMNNNLPQNFGIRELGDLLRVTLLSLRDDEGLTWQRIADDLLRFDGIDAQYLVQEFKYESFEQLLQSVEFAEFIESEYDSYRMEYVYRGKMYDGVRPIKEEQREGIDEQLNKLSKNQGYIRKDIRQINDKFARIDGRLQNMDFKIERCINTTHAADLNKLWDNFEGIQAHKEAQQTQEISGLKAQLEKERNERINLAKQFDEYKKQMEARFKNFDKYMNEKIENLTDEMKNQKQEIIYEYPRYDMWFEENAKRKIEEVEENFSDQLSRFRDDVEQEVKQEVIKKMEIDVETKLESQVLEKLKQEFQVFLAHRFDEERVHNEKCDQKTKDKIKDLGEVVEKFKKECAEKFNGINNQLENYDYHHAPTVLAEDEKDDSHSRILRLIMELERLDTDNEALGQPKVMENGDLQDWTLQLKPPNEPYNEGVFKIGHFSVGEHEYDISFEFRPKEADLKFDLTNLIWVKMI